MRKYHLNTQNKISSVTESPKNSGVRERQTSLAVGYTGDENSRGSQRVGAVRYFSADEIRSKIIPKTRRALANRRVRITGMEACYQLGVSPRVLISLPRRLLPDPSAAPFRNPVCRAATPT